MNLKFLFAGSRSPLERLIWITTFETISSTKMATRSTDSRPLMEMDPSTSEEIEGDAVTEGNLSTGDARSLFEDSKEPPESAEKQPLSLKRRIALVGALLLCVFTIFAFAFLLPCHKPKCQKLPVCPGKGHLTAGNWTHQFGGIIPIVTSLLDVTGDGRPDVIVEFDIEALESTDSSFLSQLCQNKDCRGSGILALHGSCGNSLWVFSRNSSLGLLACEKSTEGIDVKNNQHCVFIEEKTNIVLFNSKNGTTKWKSSLGGKVSSVKFVNDVDGDGQKDIVLINKLSIGGSEGYINLVSGRLGKVLGNSIPLSGGHDSNSILATHSLPSKQQFVIVCTLSHEKNTTSLWAMSVHDLFEKVTQPTKSIPGEAWGKHIPNPNTGFISVLNDAVILIQPLLTDLDGDGVKDIVFVTKENDTFLLAMNGTDLAIVWKMVVPSDAVIHKLFSTPHSIKENLTDIGLFVAHTNSSSSLLVIDGRTGGISWSFHSRTGLAVAPVPVPGLSGAQHAFVIWLPKLEAVTLISKSRKSRDISHQVNGWVPGDVSQMMNDEYARPQPRKLFSVSSDLVKKNKKDRFSSKSALLSAAEIDNEDFANYNKFDSKDEFEKVRSDDLVLKEFELYLLKDSLEKIEDTSFTEKEPFSSTREEKRADTKWLGIRKEKSSIIHKGGFHQHAIPFTKEQMHKEGVSGEENIEFKADPHVQNDLEEQLSGLTNHRKKQTVLENHRARAPLASASKDSSSLQPRQEFLKEFPGRQTRIENQDNEVNILPGKSTVTQQFHSEYHRKEYPKLETVKKPSYHKRSVTSLPKCAKSFGDVADAYVAVLLVKSVDGRQLLADITEEDPLHLGPEDYKSLFKTREGDKQAKSCLRLVPHIVSQPVIRDSYEGLDLVYTVNFVSKDHSLHVTEIRKMPMEAVFELLEGISKDTRQQQTKRGIDSFRFPSVWK